MNDSLRQGKVEKKYPVAFWEIDNFNLKSFVIL